MTREEIGERLVSARRRVDGAARAAGRDPAEITLLAATKTLTDEAVRDAVAAGVTVCGENRVQELTGHLASGAYGDARVHFIGHLQTNKVKDVVGRVELIHSISSEKLLRCVSGRAEKLGLVQDILLEINLAGESSKSGFAPEAAFDAALAASRLPGVHLMGLMGIPPVDAPPKMRRLFFSNLRALAVDITRKIGDNEVSLSCLSMGMSGDFEDAVAEGATIVRLGSALFGPRPPAGTSPA